MDKKQITGANTGLAKVAVQCSADTFVVNQSWFSASTFVVKIATFAKPETVIGHFKNIDQMKQILFLTILICSNPCLSQIERSLYTGIQKGIYVYNNQKDTLYLSEINVSLSCKFKDLQVVDSIQIDGIGSKEIIFFRSYGGKDDKVGSISVTREYVNVSKYEIWNLDTKEKMFESTNFYRSKFDTKNVGGGRIKGVVSWSYNFRIDDAGTVTISNLKIKTKGYKLELNVEKTKAKNKPVLEKSPYKYNFSADKTEGTYRYVNGKYIQE